MYVKPSYKLLIRLGAFATFVCLLQYMLSSTDVHKQASHVDDATRNLYTSHTAALTAMYGGALLLQPIQSTTFTYTPVDRSIPIRLVYFHHGEWFNSTVQPTLAHITGHTIDIVSQYDSTMHNLWLIESFLHTDGRPDHINRDIGQRRIYISGEPEHRTDVQDYDAIIDTNINVFAHPDNIASMYMPFYAHAAVSLGITYQTLLSKPDIHTLRHDRLADRRFAAYVYSNCVPMRDQVFDLLNQYKQVDAFGKCKHNTDADLGGDWHSTMQLYRRYKFVIAMDKVQQMGYVTEKIMLPMAARSIPIYFGAPDIHMHFNTDSYININKYTSLHHAMQHIQQLDQNDTAYYEMLAKPYVHERNEVNSWLIGNSRNDLFTQQLRTLVDVIHRS